MTGETYRSQRVSELIFFSWEGYGRTRLSAPPPNFLIEIAPLMRRVNILFFFTDSSDRFAKSRLSVNPFYLRSSFVRATFAASSRFPVHDSRRDGSVRYSRPRFTFYAPNLTSFLLSDPSQSNRPDNIRTFNRNKYRQFCAP